MTDFIKDVCVSEGSETNKECESVNMYYAHNYICEIKDQNVKGLLDPIFIRDIHKRLFANTENKLKAGFYSNSSRIAYFNGESMNTNTVICHGKYNFLLTNTMNCLNI